VCSTQSEGGERAPHDFTFNLNGGTIMPRSNRYVQPGYVYHLTHRCHDRKFLLQHRADRMEYRLRIRDAVRIYRVSLFDFCVTCNHVHLLGMCDRMGDLSRFMKRLAGNFGQAYNIRNGRSGAFWSERFHSTMIDGGEHLWNCLRYIDLNMVRAGVVSHPEEWDACGYQTLVGAQGAVDFLDIDRLIGLLELPDRRSLARMQRERVRLRIEAQSLEREEVWTESIAVGNEEFLERVARNIKWRKKIRKGTTKDGTGYIREAVAAYGPETAGRIPGSLTCA
jgi:putative transposase